MHITVDNVLRALSAGIVLLSCAPVLAQSPYNMVYERDRQRRAAIEQRVKDEADKQERDHKPLLTLLYGRVPPQLKPRSQRELELRTLFTTEADRQLEIELCALTGRSPSVMAAWDSAREFQQVSEQVNQLVEAQNNPAPYFVNRFGRGYIISQPGQKPHQVIFNP
jgi:hypothetical protein